MNKLNDSMKSIVGSVVKLFWRIRFPGYLEQNLGQVPTFKYMLHTRFNPYTPGGTYTEGL